MISFFNIVSFMPSIYLRVRLKPTQVGCLLSAPLYRILDQSEGWGNILSYLYGLANITVLPQNDDTNGNLRTVSNLWRHSAAIIRFLSLILTSF